MLNQVSNWEIVFVARFALPSKTHKIDEQGVFNAGKKYPSGEMFSVTVCAEPEFPYKWKNSDCLNGYREM